MIKFLIKYTILNANFFSKDNALAIIIFLKLIFHILSRGRVELYNY
jgi:hypothetical protein